MDNLDVMSQFMDVVTTFKCKACEFVCHKQDELIDHVKSAHMPPASVEGEAANQAINIPTSSTQTEPPNEVASTTVPVQNVHSNVADAATTSIIAELVDPNADENFIDVGTNLQQINIQTYGPDGTPSDQVVLVDAGVQNPSAATLFSHQNSQQQQKEVFLCGHCNMGYQSIQACKDHMVKDHNIDINDLATTGPEDQLDILNDTDAAAADASTSTDQANSSGTESSKFPGLQAIDDTLDPTSSNAATEVAISEREEMADGKVSMATQVIRKKVGRKSKAELAELAAKEKENVDNSQEETAENSTSSVNVEAAKPSNAAIIKLDEELGEEFEDANAIYIEIELPGKRKRRLPKHLTKDYLISKKAKHVFDDHGVAETSRLRIPRSLVKKLKVDMPVKCESCRAKFVTEEQLSYHMTTHTKKKGANGLPVFTCPEEACKEIKFDTTVWTDFKHHAWKEHKIDLGMIPCDVCDYRATVPSKLAVHKEIHRADKPYICDICHKGFKQQSQLKNHSLVHIAGMDIREKESMSGRHWFVQAQCNICKRTFANQKSLQSHVEAVHDKVKPFACKFCGHTAARKAMMQLHMRTHTGEKPFKCDQCDYQTGDHNSMRRHKMRHSGDKPYQCPHCSYACIQAVSLKLHLKSKHPGSESFYSCNKCAYRTVNKTLFNNHIRDHEIGLIDEVDIIPVSENPAAAVAAQTALQSGFAVKLGPITDMTNGTSNTTQLICSALNAIAPSLTDEGEPLPDNIETTVATISNDGGVKAHRITFHIPATATKNAKTAEVVVQEHLPAAQPLDPLQAATIESEIPTDPLSMDDDTNDASDIQNETSLAVVN